MEVADQEVSFLQSGAEAEGLAGARTVDGMVSRRCEAAEGDSGDSLDSGAHSASQEYTSGEGHGQKTI